VLVICISMDDVSNSDINEMLKYTNLQSFCSPFSGNCFEVALALHEMFNSHAEGFYSVYAEPEFKTDSDVLPLHTAIKIQGDLFDAGGKLHKSQLLEEFAPVQDQKLVEFEETFYYNHVVSEKLVQKIILAYENGENV